MYNLYLVKTNIKIKNNTLLNINIIAEDLSDAASNASYLKYNGEELKEHIVSVETFISNILYNTWNINDLNPDYKGESKDKQENLPPTDNI